MDFCPGLDKNLFSLEISIHTIPMHKGCLLIPCGAGTKQARVRVAQLPMSTVVQCAMALLSGGEGTINYSLDGNGDPVGCNAAPGGGGSGRCGRIWDPALIIAGYHQLVARCLLPAGLGAHFGDDNNEGSPRG
jgi:hypothetical protein